MIVQNRDSLMTVCIYYNPCSYLSWDYVLHTALASLFLLIYNLGHIASRSGRRQSTAYNAPAFNILKSKQAYKDHVSLDEKVFRAFWCDSYMSEDQ